MSSDQKQLANCKNVQVDSGGAFYIIVLKDFWHQSRGKPNGSVITNQNILYWIIWGEYSFTLVVLFVCLKNLIEIYLFLAALH